MANKLQRKPAGKPPITRHPLFPVTVALWFGALFGIGSLAISTSLIESIVVGLGLDALVPAAAPPLGATARILLAIVLAGAGGLVGASLARRIGKAKPVVRERRRATVPAAGHAAATRTGQNATPHRTRRKSLAMIEDQAVDQDLIDPAPLPGGAQILDVSQFDLAGFESADQDSPRQEFIVEPAAEDSERSSFATVFGADAPLDVDRPQVPEAMADPVTEPAQPTARASDPLDDPSWKRELAAQQAPTKLVADDHEALSGQAAVPVDSMRQSFGAPAKNRPVFEPVDSAPFRQLSPEPPEIESEPVIERQPQAEEPASPVPPSAPERPSIFNTEPAPGLFAAPLTARVSAIQWQEPLNNAPFSAPVQAAPVAAGETAPSVSHTEANEPAAALAHHRADVVTHKSGDEPAAERIATAPLDDLSHVELLERLALSIRRKQEQASEPSAADEVEQVTAPVITAKQPFVTQSAPPAPQIPTALMPVGLDLDDDDEEGQAGFIPPRRIGGAHDIARDSADVALTTQDVPEISDADADEQDEATLDEGYSSLLNFSRPAADGRRFVRIEEPDPLGGEIEPVVIFPGQAGNGPAPFARPTEAGRPAPQTHLDQTPESEDAASDEAPAAAVAKQPASPDGPPPFAPPTNLPDRNETENALRAALANIQRMSGVA